MFKTLKYLKLFLVPYKSFIIQRRFPRHALNFILRDFNDSRSEERCLDLQNRLENNFGLKKQFSRQADILNEADLETPFFKKEKNIFKKGNLKQQEIEKHFDRIILVRQNRYFP